MWKLGMLITSLFLDRNLECRVCMSFPQEWGGVSTTPRSSHFPAFAFSPWDVVSSQSECFVERRREWTLCVFATYCCWKKICKKKKTNHFLRSLSEYFVLGTMSVMKEKKVGFSKVPEKAKGRERELPVTSVLPTPRCCLSPECAWPRVTVEGLSARLSGAGLLLKGLSPLLREKENKNDKTEQASPLCCHIWNIKLGCVNVL